MAADQPAASLLAAAEALIDAYRARYRRPSTEGIRRDAPLRQEVVALNAEVIASRASAAAAGGSLTELERLRAAVAYCRPRLKLAGYRDTLDAILRGDKDESIRNPDLTPVVLSHNRVPEVDLTSDAWRRAVEADKARRTDDQHQAYLAAVAQEFGGTLPDDAWHLYRIKGLTPAQAAAQHREASAT